MRLRKLTVGAYRAPVGTAGDAGKPRAPALRRFLTAAGGLAGRRLTGSAATGCTTQRVLSRSAPAASNAADMTSPQCQQAVPASTHLERLHRLDTVQKHDAVALLQEVPDRDGVSCFACATCNARCSNALDRGGAPRPRAEVVQKPNTASLQRHGGAAAAWRQQEPSQLASRAAARQQGAAWALTQR